MYAFKHRLFGRQQPNHSYRICQTAPKTQRVVLPAVPSNASDTVTIEAEVLEPAAAVASAPQAVAQDVTTQRTSPWSPELEYSTQSEFLKSQRLWPLWFHPCMHAHAHAVDHMLTMP